MATTERNRNRESWRAVSEWSQSSRMNDLEALMWRAESHPELSSAVVALELLAGLKAAGTAAGGSVNDAYLAGLLGGLARYHDAFGAPINDLPVVVPVSVRRPDDARGGNRFTAVQIAGPASVADPLERITAIRAQVLTARVEPALWLIGLAAPVLSRLPSEVARAVRGRIGLQADLSASNFPGLREDVYMAGARVERFYAFGPLPGTAVMATLVSHQGTCCITLNCDGEAIADPDLLTRCMEAAFDEVVAPA